MLILAGCVNHSRKKSRLVANFASGSSVGATFKDQGSITRYTVMWPKTESLFSLIIIQTGRTDPNLSKKYISDDIHLSSEGTKMVITPEINKSLGIKAK